MQLRFESDDERYRLARLLGVPEDAENDVLHAAISDRLFVRSSSSPASRPPAERRDFARRDALIAEAVAAGKFTQGRAGHYKSQWDRNPQKAEATIAKLRPGVAAPTRPSSSSDDAYPTDWLPENRVKPGGNTRSD